MLDHVAHEYVMLQAAAVEMTKPHSPPVNHLVQEAFLIHARCILGFFLLGIDRPRKDDITIRDFCVEKVEIHGAEEKAKKLRKAIDKTVAHLTMSRVVELEESKLVAFDGPTHLHGTVRFIQGHWDEFLRELDADPREFLSRRVEERSRAMNVNIREAAAQLERAASQPGWRKDTLP